MNLRRQPLYSAVFAVCGAALVGCSKKGAPKFDLVPVSGVVKVDGQPVAEATVAYYFAGTPPTGYFGSAGITDSHGHYELRSGTTPGALAGSYKVTVSRLLGKDGKPVVLPEGQDLEQLRRQGAAVESLPPRFSDQAQTELKMTVEKGKAEGYDLDVKSS